MGPQNPMVLLGRKGEGLSDGVPPRILDVSRANGSGFSLQPRGFVCQKEDNLDCEDTVGYLDTYL